MLNCENCLKNDVCGKKEEINELIKKLRLNGIYQTLATKNLLINIECKNHSGNKILRGE